MKKSVLIATYNDSKNNYGAVFQSFALSETIKKLGHDAVFVTLEKPPLNSSIKLSFKTKLKRTIVKMLSLPNQKKSELRTKKFKIFKEKTQKRICYTDFDELINTPPNADVYLSGSDQVWNPQSFREDFFFPYVSKNKKIVSYAASMGVEEIPQERIELFSKYIARYDCVSVREDTMKKIISQYTDKEIHHHIDPVFLVKREVWESLAKKYENLKYERYIFLYLINWNKKNDEVLLRLKKETGLPLVLVTLGGLKPRFADQVIMDASPEEFLFLLNNAEMVIASSFHGVALSVVFNKPFIAVSGRHSFTRIQSLLRGFNLTHHDTLNMSVESAQANYTAVNEMIAKERDRSVEYLKMAIEGEKIEDEMNYEYI